MSKEKLKPCAMLSDVCICETAGFVDLETRFKRMEQSGYIAQFHINQFDTQDMRDIFLGDETAIYADDDEDTVMKKLYLQDLKRKQIIQSKLGDLVETNEQAEAPQGERSSVDKSPSQRSSTESVQNTES